MHEIELPQNVYNQKIIDIMNSLNDQEVRGWLERKLQYGNEITLGKRLCNIIKTYPIIKKLFTNRDEIDSFINKVVNTRNYFTHYDENLRNQAAQEDLLREITDKLKIILDMCFLIDLEFNSEDIEILMRRNESYKNELKR